jgi:hypothetical protein
MLLAIHSLLRWVVLITAIVALLRARKGLGGGIGYLAGARQSLAVFMAAVHLQLLLGLVLFGTSSLTRGAMKDMGAAMQDPSTRFFIAEHPALMLAAVVAVTLTVVIARRGPDDVVRHRRAAIGVALALGLILAGIPWQRAMLPTF